MPYPKLPTTYRSLLNKVKNTLILGQQKIEAEKVKTYWQTGNLIHEHIKKRAQRAEYGTQVIRRLAHDLQMEPTVLHRCVKFAQKYSRSRIVAGRQQFSWSHYRELIKVEDNKERHLLEDKAAKSSWTSVELEERIKSRRFNTIPVKSEALRVGAGQELLTPKRGTLYTYRIVKRPALGAKGVEGGETPPLLLDLGFGIFKRISTRAQNKFAADQIVESDYDPADESFSLKSSERTAKDLFTYQASIERVVDGDTLKVRIDLGFNLEHRETLRLRDIDCPEMDTKEGQAAKTFVQSLLKEADTVIIHTSNSDKYDRYLADVFISGDVFLNNLLLEKHFAQRA